MDGFTRDFTMGLDPSVHREDPEFLNHREMEAGKPLGCPGTAPCQEAQKAELGLSSRQSTGSKERNYQLKMDFFLFFLLSCSSSSPVFHDICVSAYFCPVFLTASKF